MFKTRRSSGREIYRTIFILNDATEKKKKMSKMSLTYLKNLQHQKTQKKERKALTFENAIILLKRRQKVLNGFKSKIFPNRKTKGKGHPWNLAKQLKF